MTARTTILAAALAAGTLWAAGAALSQEKKEEFKGADPREHSPADQQRRMIEAATPNRFHKRLEVLLGDWEVEVRMWMAPGAEPQVMKGTAKTAWLYEGKWIRTDIESPMFKAHTIMGYDNFKKKYVTSTVNSMETALRTFEGNFGKDGKSIFLYGFVDEYMTGEHDKMAGYFLRLGDGPDAYVGEVHDFTIGDEGTKVVEFAFTRKGE